MSAEVTVAAEHLVTVVTGVGFDVGVSQEVRLQVGTLVKRSTTGRALVRRFLRTNPYILHLVDIYLFLVSKTR